MKIPVLASNKRGGPKGCTGVLSLFLDAECSFTVTGHLHYQFTELHYEGERNISLIITKFPLYIRELTVSFDDYTESNSLFPLEMSPVSWHTIVLHLLLLNQNVLS